jgi:tRNA modification GTPase
MMDHATIAAIATPQGSAGVGIIRISGKDAVRIGMRIFTRSRSQTDLFHSHASDSTLEPPSETLIDAGHFQSHHMYHGFIKNPDDGSLIDEVLIVFMKAPHSYTAEDVVEIQAHSSPLILQSILELVLLQGARLAGPGEFTRRAYLNGRLDLTQAEAVIDIINARSTTALDIALSQIQGGLKSRIETARNILVEFLAEIEAAIDFPDDMTDITIPEDHHQKLESSVYLTLQQLIDNYDSGHCLREGFQVTIAGAPNVGKSSLMNLLINKERSIVTTVPGTTRDLIEDSLHLNGIPLVLTDTAGLHETDDPVESIGIQKARQHINQSDLILFMIDASVGVTPQDLFIFEELKLSNLILVFNKIDLTYSQVDIELPQDLQSITQVKISALHHAGIDDLKQKIIKFITDSLPDRQETIVPNLRHKTALEEALQAISSILRTLLSSSPLYELMAIDVREAIDKLDEILGTTVKIDVLDNIFQNFCIGK